MMALILSPLALAASAQAYEPGSVERLQILLAAAQSKATDVTTKLSIDSLTAPQTYENRLSIIGFECSNGKSTTADYSFDCTVTYGLDNMMDDDSGYSSVYQTMISGTVTKGIKEVDFTRTVLTAG